MSPYVLLLVLDSCSQQFHGLMFHCCEFLRVGPDGWLCVMEKEAKREALSFILVAKIVLAKMRRHTEDRVWCQV